MSHDRVQCGTPDERPLRPASAECGVRHAHNKPLEVRVHHLGLTYRPRQVGCGNGRAHLVHRLLSGRVRCERVLQDDSSAVKPVSSSSAPRMFATPSATKSGRRPRCPTPLPVLLWGDWVPLQSRPALDDLPTRAAPAASIVSALTTAFYTDLVTPRNTAVLFQCASLQPRHGHWPYREAMRTPREFHHTSHRPFRSQALLWMLKDEFTRPANQIRNQRSCD